MPLEAALIALAALAGNTVVTAAVTDAWDAARKGFARLLGRGDPDRTKAVEQRLEDTRERLTEATGADLERTRAALEAQWVTRGGSKDAGLCVARLWFRRDPGQRGLVRGLQIHGPSALSAWYTAVAGACRRMAHDLHLDSTRIT